MRPSSHGMRAFVAAVTLLLATMLAIDSASAQASSQGLRTAASAESHPGAPAEHSATAEDDCQPRRAVRRPVSVAAPSVLPARVCDCDFRTGATHDAITTVTVREAAAEARSIDLSLLHQAFRC